MKWLLRLVGLCLVCGYAGFASPEDQYIRIYDLIQQADSLNESGNGKDALAKYEEALASLQKLKSAYPGWSEKVVAFRMDYLSGKITALKQKYPVAETPSLTPTTPAQPVVPAPPPVPVEVQNQMAELQAQLRQMQSDRQLLEAKLREALSVQPAAVDPKELAKAEEKIRSLEKEKDLLQVTLTQEKDKTARLIAPEKLQEIRQSLEDTNQKLAKQADQAARLLADKDSLQRQLLMEQERAAKKVDAETLKDTQKSLEQAKANIAQQTEAAAAMLKEKELLLKKLQEAQAKSLVHPLLPPDSAAALTEARNKLAQMTAVTEALKKDKEFLQKQIDEERKKAAALADPAELQRAREALADAKSKFEQEQANAEAARREQAALKNDQERLKIQKENLDKSLGEANQKLAQQTTTADQLLKENEALQQRLKAEREKAAQLLDPAEVKKIQQELNQANQKLAQQADQVAALTKEKEMLQESLKKQQPDNALTRSLEAENVSLKKQLVELRERNEALAPRVEESNRQLERTQKELALLKTSFEALRLEKELLEKRIQVATSAPAPGPDPRLAEAEKKLADARQAVQTTEAQVAALQREKAILQKARADLEQQLASAQAEANRLRNLDIEQMRKLERELLEARAATRDREQKITALAGERGVLEARLAALISEREQELSKRGKEGKKLKELEKEKERLQNKLNDATKELYAVRSRSYNLRLDDLNTQLANLRARVEAYEMKRVPLTPEELALLRAPAPRFPADIPKRPVKELPGNTKMLIAEAQTDASAGRLKEAEQKYAEVLKVDDKHVYTLYKLAGVMLDQDKYAEAEKTVNQGLALEPDNAGLLYQLGIVRYHQGKLDESAALLSRSIKQNSNNAEVYNYLGFVLGKKGMLNEAETAFRKAVQLEPGFSMAHLSLAWVYANQKPPFLELSRWHYNKAVADGQPRDPELEKLFNPRP